MTTQQVQVTRRTVPMPIAAVLVAGAFGIGVLAAGAVGVGMLAGGAFAPAGASETAARADTSLIVKGSAGGGIRYLGIPYAAPAAAASSVVAWQACQVMNDEAYAAQCAAYGER